MIEQLKEFTVRTQCGRNFIWAAYDLDDCMRTVVYAGYRATFIQEYKKESVSK